MLTLLHKPVCLVLLPGSNLRSFLMTVGIIFIPVKMSGCTTAPANSGPCIGWCLTNQPWKAQRGIECQDGNVHLVLFPCTLLLDFQTGICFLLLYGICGESDLVFLSLVCNREVCVCVCVCVSSRLQSETFLHKINTTSLTSLNTTFNPFILLIYLFYIFNDIVYNIFHTATNAHMGLAFKTWEGSEVEITQQCVCVSWHCFHWSFQITTSILHCWVLV